MHKYAEQPISDISEIDWNELIINKRKLRPELCNKGPEFWNKRAPSFAEHAGKTFYPDSFIRIMEPQPSWTVLDMGCGGGSLAIPLAGKVKHITAVDYSRSMIDILSDETRRRGIKNIETINASWTDNWQDAGIGIYDAAIASRSLAVDDVRSALDRLNNAARKRVIISTVVGDGPFDRRMSVAIGREYVENIDYIYYYNLLYQMGINADITFISDDKEKTFADRDEAFESVKWMFQEMTDTEELKLKKYLDEHLVEKNGRFVFDYVKSSKWAVLRWDK